ncbi:MAG TPA: hypothetical protein VJS92_18370 [Candidatus Polarisedimenticolaceae bacterium]|nr:hypothetical protein [Candidatus Polarisedimenticolaceae bacterium]
MSDPARLLAWLLRLSGIAMLPAFAAAMLPLDWMAASHAWLGLGSLPREPIVEYLARSISLLYGIHGVLLLVVARDVRRHATVIRYVGTVDIGFGAAMIAIDLNAGLPDWWTLGEGPPIAVCGLIVLALLRATTARSTAAPG